ncbi:MAG TPA: hypothetical protein VIO12_01755 [Thermoanaerobaculia bacterium]
MDSKSQQVIKRLIPPLAVWALGKLLETPRMQGALEEVDSRAYVHKRNAARAVRRAGKNAARNPAWVVVGVAAIVVGIGMLTKATRPKRYGK